MSERTLVTGFLSFGRFAENPSAALAHTCGRRFELLEVAYDAADAFVESLHARDFDRLLMLGVCGHASRPKFERIARNRVNGQPDVRAVIRGPRAIDPAAPDVLPATLDINCLCDMSDDAGGYLCNYLFFRVAQALQASPQRRFGFLHVAPADVMALDAQHNVLARLLDRIECPDRSTPPR